MCVTGWLADTKSINTISHFVCGYLNGLYSQLVAVVVIVSRDGLSG